MEYIGLITVRTSSSRLKNKCLLNLSKYTKVIEHVVLRCLESNIKPIICTTSSRQDDKLLKIVKKLDIKYFRGSEKNKIKRWYDCSIKYNLNYFHTIDADDLYFDPISVKNSLELALKKKAEIVHPSKASRYGGASEGYSFSKKGIKKLYQNLNSYVFKNINSFDTEMIDSFISDTKLIEYTLKVQSYEINSKIRFTLDYREDFKMFKIIFKKFGIYEKRKIINEFLIKKRNILKINYFKNTSWSQKQKKFIIPLKK